MVKHVHRAEHGSISACTENQFISSSEYSKKRHVELKVWPADCDKECVLLEYLEEDQSSLSVEEESVKCD